MTGWVREVLERYGQTVTLCRRDGERDVRAFLQPVTEKGERAAEAVTTLGSLDGRLWLYLGREPLEERDALAWNGRRFQVRSCRAFYVGEALSHYWAALEQERER